MIESSSSCWCKRMPVDSAFEVILKRTAVVVFAVDADDDVTDTHEP